jgi:hypothetical protein
MACGYARGSRRQAADQADVPEPGARGLSRRVARAANQPTCAAIQPKCSLFSAIGDLREYTASVLLAARSSHDLVSLA